jgi:hypothetical protein
MNAGKVFRIATDESAYRLSLALAADESDRCTADLKAHTEKYRVRNAEHAASMVNPNVYETLGRLSIATDALKARNDAFEARTGFSGKVSP